MKLKKVVSISTILVVMLGLFIPTNVSMVDETVGTTSPKYQIFCLVSIIGAGDFLRSYPFLFWEMENETFVRLYGFNIETRTYELVSYFDESVAGQLTLFFGRTKRVYHHLFGEGIEIYGFALMSISYHIN